MKNWFFMVGGITVIVFVAFFSLSQFNLYVEEQQRRANLKETVSSVVDKVDAYSTLPAEERSLEDYALIMEELTDLQRQAATIKPKDENELTQIENQVAAMSQQAFSQFSQAGNSQLAQLESELTGLQSNTANNPFMGSRQRPEKIDRSPITAAELKRRHDKILMELGFDPKQTEYISGSKLAIEYHNRYYQEIQSQMSRLSYAETKEFYRLMGRL
ncbi:MAG: hypothetical protein MI867_22085 [Pseudomonadales bacterium]|nr:hypothetical protein [Pseudomonadales bacterium]